MEKRIPIINTTAMPIYVGSNMVPPGETRDFPESQVPLHLRPQEEAAPAAPEQPADLIADLLKLTVKEVVEAFDALSDEELDRIDELENADGSPRKTLAAAIAEERLKRAAANDAPGGNEGGNTDGAAAENTNTSEGGAQA